MSITPKPQSVATAQKAQTPNAPVPSRAQTFKTLLDQSQKEIAAALPKHLTADRLSRIAMTEVRKNPDLLNCELKSLIGAVIQAAQLGLEPGSALGHCYLVPFNNRKAGIKECQFIIGYRGMIELARRSGACRKVIARAVYDNDTFEYEFGLEERLIHKPGPTKKGQNLTHVYFVAELLDGTRLFDVMTRDEVEEIRGESANGTSSSSPWVTDYEAMAKKSVVRRGFKFLPVSIEIQQAVGLDEMADRGISQGNGAVIDTQGRVLTKAEEIAQMTGAMQLEDDLPIDTTPAAPAEAEGEFAQAEAGPLPGTNG